MKVSNRPWVILLLVLPLWNTANAACDWPSGIRTQVVIAKPGGTNARNVAAKATDDIVAQMNLRYPVARRDT